MKDSTHVVVNEVILHDRIIDQVVFRVDYVYSYDPGNPYAEAGSPPSEEFEIEGVSVAEVGDAIDDAGEPVPPREEDKKLAEEYFWEHLVFDPSIERELLERARSGD